MQDKTLRSILMIVIFLVALVGISVTLNDRKENKPSNTEDGRKFKEEYEAYNNKEREDDKGNYFQELDIPENNPIKYASIEEAIDLLNKGTGVIYFGYPTCPWCRNAVPVLLEAAKEKKINRIYYLNVNEYKNTFMVNDGKVEKVKEEKEGYYELLNSLDSVLDPYVLTSDGKTYEVGEKRIYVPFVVFVKDGKIVNTHLGTVNLEGTQTKYDALTKSQHDELLDTYLSAIEDIQSNGYCDEDCE